MKISPAPLPLLSSASTFVCLFVAGFLPSAHAQITVVHDNTNNAILQSITIDGLEYTSSDFINVSVDGFSMYNSGTYGASFQINADGTGPYTGSAATALLEDLSVSTGFAALVDDTFSFNSAVENRAGADLFIFEYNPSESSDLLVTINGQTVNLGSSPFTTFGNTVNMDVRKALESPYGSTNGIKATTVAQLEAITLAEWSQQKSDSSGTIGYAAIDLSDFGVADGASVTSIQMTGSNDWDITGVIGLAVIPEPSTYAMLGGLGALLLAYTRRKNFFA